MTISALIVAKNEEEFVWSCLTRIIPYVDEVIFVDNSSTDKTKEMAEQIASFKGSKVKIFSYPETQNMGELRQFSLDQATSDWIWQIDCDEFYEPEDCEFIVDAVNNTKVTLSFRVGYENLSWRAWYKQANFEHYPDRLYRRDVIDRYDGILPNDMTKVKKEFYTFRPFLEYDNAEDKSFENPVQPILPVRYYHLARTRGYAMEIRKWTQYNRNMHPETDIRDCELNARKNQWVSGLYDIEKIDVPENIPTQTIPNPRVSIIITNYNYSEWLCNAITSVAEQTTKPYEIIVVDDCSTDDSKQVLSELSKNYNFRLLQQPENKGVVQCRNWGINESKGDFYILIDADDYIEPTYIEKTLEKQAETQAEIVFTDMHVFNAVDYNHTYPEFSILELQKNQIIPSVCALVKRQVFNACGGFREDTVYDDYEFWLRLAITHKFKFAQVHEFLFNYNRKPGSRIEDLDKRQEEGFQQLNQEYGKII